MTTLLQAGWSPPQYMKQYLPFDGSSGSTPSHNSLAYSEIQTKGRGMDGRGRRLREGSRKRRPSVPRHSSAPHLARYAPLDRSEMNRQLAESFHNFPSASGRSLAFAATHLPLSSDSSNNEGRQANWVTAGLQKQLPRSLRKPWLSQSPRK